jgi:hypothetical protein
MDRTQLIDNTKTFIANLRSVAISGFIFWFIIVATLQLVGLIDLKVACGWCVDLMPRFISQAIAASGALPIRDPYLPIHVTLVILPKG